jgi:transposase InsO family protein
MAMGADSGSVLIVCGLNRNEPHTFVTTSAVPDIEDVAAMATSFGQPGLPFAGLWVADFTYIRVSTGFCFVAAILDACSRKVVGYALSQRLDTLLALAALRAVGANRAPPKGCIHHTDRECQYASQAYRDALEAAGLKGSMSSVVNPYHNAQAESFLKTLKVEEVYRAGYSLQVWGPRVAQKLRDVANQRRCG